MINLINLNPWKLKICGPQNDIFRLFQCKTGLEVTPHLQSGFRTCEYAFHFLISSMVQSHLGFFSASVSSAAGDLHAEEAGEGCPIVSAFTEKNRNSRNCLSMFLCRDCARVSISTNSVLSDRWKTFRYVTKNVTKILQHTLICVRCCWFWSVSLRLK